MTKVSISPGSSEFTDFLKICKDSGASVEQTIANCLVFIITNYMAANCEDGVTDLRQAEVDVNQVVNTVWNSLSEVIETLEKATVH